MYLSGLERFDNQLKKFWKVQEPILSRPLLGTDQYCEEQYINSVVRGDDGKYTWKMPVKSNLNQLVHSKQATAKRFFQVERRPKLIRIYKNSMSHP